LSASSATTHLRVHGGGFVTREMLEQALDELRQEVGRARTSSHGGAVLVDLREVAGYETACLLPVRQFLGDAAGLGLRRIAVVAESSVLRTASRLAAHSLTVELRTFEHERTASKWLHGPGVVMPRPHGPSSSTSPAAP